MVFNILIDFTNFLTSLKKFHQHNRNLNKPTPNITVLYCCFIKLQWGDDSVH